MPATTRTKKPSVKNMPAPIRAVVESAPRAPVAPTWKDTSSFSYGEKDRTPTVFEYRTKALRITVHRHIHGAKDDWFVSCREVGIEKHLLAAKPAEDAKTEGLAFVKAHLTKMLAEVS